jgi:hypothetical protein
MAVKHTKFATKYQLTKSLHPKVFYNVPKLAFGYESIPTISSYSLCYSFVIGFVVLRVDISCETPHVPITQVSIIKSDMKTDDYIFNYVTGSKLHL